MKKLSRRFTIVRIIAELILLYFAWTSAPWSVALILTLQSFAIEGIAVTLQLHAKHITAHKKGMDAAMDAFDGKAKDFDDFVQTINLQADKVRKVMTTCRECDIHGHTGGIRPGSVHLKSAPNCLMNPKKV